MSEAVAKRQPCIALCGAGDPTPEEREQAAVVGRLIGERGGVLVCGGLGGAMAAACEGAKRAGGITIGIIPGLDRAAANPWVDHVICTGLGQARNAVVVATAEAVIAVGGGWGTLSEIALALRIGRPTILLGGWATPLTDPATRDTVADLARLGSRPHLAETPESAVRLAFQLPDTESG